MSGESNVEIQLRAKNLTQEAFDKVSQALKALEDQQEKNNNKTTAFSRYLDELDPRANTASATFKNLKGTLEELWENPTAGVRQFAGALTGELDGALGGAAVGLGLFTAGAAVAGVVSFELAEKAAAIGGNLNDMSEKTGIAVPVLSRFSYALQVAGSDVNTMSNAVFMMQRNMAEGGPKFEEGLHRINISIDEFKGLKPDEQFLAIAEGLKRTEDPSQRAAAAMEIFGRQGRDLLPTLLKLNDALAITSGLNPWTDAEAKEAEVFEMQVAALKLQAEQIAITLGRDVLPAVSAVVGWFAEGARSGRAFGDVLGDNLIPGYAEFTAWLGRGALAAETAGAKQDVINRAVQLGAPATIAYADAVKYLNDKFKELHPQQESATAAADAWLAKLAETATKAMAANAAQFTLTESLAEYGIVQGDITDFGDQVAKDWEKRAAEAKKYQESVDNLTTAERGYQGVIDDLGNHVVNAIRYELEHTASIEDVARVYHVLPAQVKEIERALKDEGDAAKQSAEVYKKAVDEVRKVEDARGAEKMNWINLIGEADRVASQRQFQNDVKTITEIQKLEDDHFDHVMKGSLSTKDYQLLKAQEWRDGMYLKFQGSEADWDAYVTAVEHHYGDMVDDIDGTLNKKLREDSEHLLGDLTGSWGNFFADVITSGGDWKDALKKDVWDLLKQDFKDMLGDMINNILKGYLDKGSQMFGGWLASLFGGGGGGSAPWWLALIPGFGGGGGSSTPITGGYFDGNGNWVPLPGVPGDYGPGISGPTDPNHEAAGGIIRAAYAADGMFASPLATGPGLFTPRLTDTVPAMLTPGEGILNTRAMHELGEPMLHHLNRGGSLAINTSALEREMRDTRTMMGKALTEIRRTLAAQPTMLRDAMLLTGAGR